MIGQLHFLKIFDLIIPLILTVALSRQIVKESTAALQTTLNLKTTPRVPEPEKIDSIRAEIKEANENLLLQQLIIYQTANDTLYHMLTKCMKDEKKILHLKQNHIFVTPREYNAKPTFSDTGRYIIIARPFDPTRTP